MTHLGKRRYNVSLPKVNNRRDGVFKENDGDWRSTLIDSRSTQLKLVCPNRTNQRKFEISRKTV